MNTFISIKKEHIIQTLQSIRRIIWTVFLIMCVILLGVYIWASYVPWGDAIACMVNFVHQEHQACTYSIPKNWNYFNKHIDKCLYSVSGVVEKHPSVSDTFAEIAQKSFVIDWVSAWGWSLKCLIYEVKEGKLTNNLRLFDSFHCYLFNFYKYILPTPNEDVLFEVL